MFNNKEIKEQIERKEDRTWTAHAIVDVVFDDVVVIDEDAAEDSCWGWYTPPATPPSNIS